MLRTRESGSREFTESKTTFFDDFETSSQEPVEEVNGRASDRSDGAHSSDSFGSFIGDEINAPCIIHPKNMKKIKWDLFIGFIIIWTVLITPYRIGFDLPASGGWLFIDNLVDVLFLRI